MVYNESVYTAAAPGEKLRARFGGRVSSAVRNSGYAVAEEDAGQVLSFFGKTDDTAGDRAVPSSRRRVAAAYRENAAAARDAQSERAGAKRRVEKRRVVTPSEDIGKAFGRAYARSESTRRITAAAAAAPANQYRRGDVPEGALRRGRSNIPGSRHAVLITDSSGKVSVRSKLAELFTSHRIAEHKAKKAPFPLAFVTLIIICTAMVMTILFSFAKIGESTDENNRLRAEMKSIREETEIVELQLAERDDIREIESIAVNQIGMVSSDMVQNRFISVAGADRVVLFGEEEETAGSASSFLSVFGEYFD